MHKLLDQVVPKRPVAVGLGKGPAADRLDLFKQTGVDGLRCGRGSSDQLNALGSQVALKGLSPSQPLQPVLGQSVDLTQYLDRPGRNTTIDPRQIFRCAPLNPDMTEETREPGSRFKVQPNHPPGPEGLGHSLL